jgi:hypothetical protein
MRSEVVVFAAPVFDEEASFSEGSEPVLVEAIIPESAVEAFDESILHGFAGLDVVDEDTSGLSPQMKGTTGKLWTRCRW